MDGRKDNSQDSRPAEGCCAEPYWRQKEMSVIMIPSLLKMFIFYSSCVLTLILIFKISHYNVIYLEY